MTETLRQAVAQVEQLTPEQQDAIAKLMLRELEEREWETLVGSEASLRFLQRIVADAQAEDTAGKTRESSDRW